MDGVGQHLSGDEREPVLRGQLALESDIIPGGGDFGKLEHGNGDVVFAERGDEGFDAVGKLMEGQVAAEFDDDHDVRRTDESGLGKRGGGGVAVPREVEDVEGVVVAQEVGIGAGAGIEAESGAEDVDFSRRR